MWRSTAAATKQPLADRSCKIQPSLRQAFLHVRRAGMLLVTDCDNHIATPNDVTGFMLSVNHYTINSILLHIGHSYKKFMLLHPLFAVELNCNMQLGTDCKIGPFTIGIYGNILH
jgi:hypothetical protein